MQEKFLKAVLAQWYLIFSINVMCLISPFDISKQYNSEGNTSVFPFSDMQLHQ